MRLAPRALQAGAAEPVAPREQQLRLLVLPGDVGLTRAVEGMQAGQERRDVRRHAGAARSEAVLVAGPGAAPRGPTGWMLEAAGQGIERIEAVTEDARRIVWDEGVLATPARTVHRVERVEIDEDSEAVRRRPVAGRTEAVDGLTLIRDPAEEALETT